MCVRERENWESKRERERKRVKEREREWRLSVISQQEHPLDAKSWNAETIFVAKITFKTSLKASKIMNDSPKEMFLNLLWLLTPFHGNKIGLATPFVAFTKRCQIVYLEDLLSLSRAFRLNATDHTNRIEQNIGIIGLICCLVHSCFKKVFWSSEFSYGYSK
jgi:hypothetical protein